MNKNPTLVHPGETKSDRQRIIIGYNRNHQPTFHPIANGDIAIITEDRTPCVTRLLKSIIDQGGARVRSRRTRDGCDCPLHRRRCFSHPTPGRSTCMRPVHGPGGFWAWALHYLHGAGVRDTAAVRATHACQHQCDQLYPRQVPVARPRAHGSWPRNTNDPKQQK